MRNFIRGMGVGILIATIVFATAYMLVGKEISDDEIRSRAKSLGMVEKDQTVIRPKEDTDGEQQNPEGENGGSDQEQPQDVMASQITQDQVPDDPAGDTQPVEPEPGQDTPTEPQQSAEPDNGINENGVKQIEIRSGMDGVTICYMLEENGIVDDAMAFNKYLSANKLQMKLRPGSYELRSGMSYEEVAKKIVY